MTMIEQLRALVARDAAAGRFAAWGLSTVVDENVGAPVISREEFEQLHEAAGLESEWPIGNAGLIHVYGYMLSTVQTPYGLKRDRWDSGALARALGRDPAAFRLPDDAAGGRAGETVLQRVTGAVLPRLVDPAPQRGGLLTIDDGLPGTGIVFRTVVVRHRAGTPAALLYGVRDDQRMRVVTAFPLASASPDALAALERETPRMRYNAALATVPPRSTLVRLPANSLHALADRDGV